MNTATRYNPTNEGAAFIRTILANAGIKARVAKTRFAYRVVADDVERVISSLALCGFAGPVGGEPVRNGLREVFAYDFANMGAA